LSSPAAAANRAVRAHAAYERATHLRTALDSGPEKNRKKADYENVIRAFKSVHFYDPSYGKAPLALNTVGDLYKEMGQRFRSDEYYRAAIQAYEYLLAQYPQSPVSSQASFNIAEVYRSGLEDSAGARKAFQEFLEKHPRDAKAVEAREKLKKLEQSVEEAQAVEPKPVSASPKTERRLAGALPEVTSLRRWVGPSYSRIVINVQSEVKFESSRVPNPDRIVLDLLDARLSSELLGKTFPVEDGFLRQVRIGQFQPNVTRVVLDVAKVEGYSVFTLPNPFRLVIDINGPPVVAEKAPEPKPAEAKSTKAPEAAPPAEGPTLAAAKAKPGAPKAEPPGPVEKEAPVRPTKEQPVKEVATAPEKPKSSRAAEKKETASLKTPALPTKPSRTEEAPAKRISEPPALAILKPPPLTEAGSRTLTRALGLKIGRIVIDPGHGGHDTGTIGPTGLREKDLVLDVGLKLKRLLEEKTNAEVIMTRSDDTFVPLEERTAIANQKAADLFISVHANASRDRSARGIETYYLNFTSNPEALEVAARENAASQESVHQLQDLIKKIALTEKIEESQDFATQVQREVYLRLKKITGAQKDRGIKKAPFVVLIGANMPSVLAEISFLTNPRDEKLLKKSDHRAQIAEALCNGVAHYVGSLGGIKVAREESTRAVAEGSRQQVSASASNF
jgi:N-acetylmuramoyl-L-alanine amidase